MAPFHCLPLAQAPETVPTLAGWFAAEWSDYYAGRSLAEIEAEFPVVADDSLPLIVVAVRDGEPLGTAALRERSIHSFASVGPWLGGLYVAPPYRRQGVARKLIETVEAEARRRGCQTLYAGTVSAQALFDALGWRRLAETVQDAEPVTVYAKPLG